MSYSSQEERDIDYEANTSDVSWLFDLSTVATKDPDEHRKQIKSRTVTMPRVVLTGNSVSVVEESILSYYEELSPVKSKVALPIPRGCGRDNRDTQHYVMPLLRLDMVEREYHEPIRSREKNWVLDSQRAALNKEPPAEPQLSPGKYAPRPALSHLQWSPAFQTLLRKNCLLRRPAVISDTHTFVSIYGVGISGRVAAPGSQTARIIVIEAYSVWNSETYSLMLPVPKLQKLLYDRAHLLKPGNKQQLVEALVELLYFDYTILLPSQTEEVEELRPVHVHHLEPFTVPNGYPSTIADIISSLTYPPQITDTTKVILHQSLQISSIKRENGPVVRRRNILEKQRLDAIAEAEAIAAWNAIPRRMKGYQRSFLFRYRTKFIIVSGYRFPKKPSAVIFKGHAFQECKRIPHSLSLGALGPSLGIKVAPMQWSDETVNAVVTKLVKSLKISHIGESAYNLRYEDFGGPDIELTPIKTCVNWQHIPKTSLYVNNVVSLRKTRDEPIVISTEEVIAGRAYGALGRNSVRRLYPWQQNLIPRREIGRRRLISQCCKFGGIYGVCSVFLTGDLSVEVLPSIEAVEQQLKEGKFGREVTPLLLGPNVSVTVEIYFPSLSDSRLRGMNDGAGPRLMKVVFARPDICRLISNKYDIRVALRIGHANYNEFAQKEEIDAVEIAWRRILTTLMSQARWRCQHEVSSEYHSRISCMINSIALVAEDISETIRSADTVALPALSYQLQWPTVIYNKNAIIMSDVESRQNPRIQLVVWQRGFELGFVGYDREYPEIYSLRTAPEHQEVLCSELQAYTPAEIAINMTILVSSLLYVETPHRHIIFNEVDKIEEGENYVEDDYEERAAVALQEASEAARARSSAGARKAARKEEDEDDAPVIDFAGIKDADLDFDD